VAEGPPRFRVYELCGRPRESVTAVAVAGDTLVLSNDRAAVVTALRHAAAGWPAAPADAEVRDLLAAVDRRQGVWVAAALDRFGPVPRLRNPLLELVLRPVFKYADRVEGGVACAADVQTAFRFHARDEEGARQLQVLLGSACESAPAAPLLFNDTDLRLLFQLLATGQVARTGRTVTLRCHLRADQLAANPVGGPDTGYGQGK
jgi:hypothetical protein